MVQWTLYEVRKLSIFPIVRRHVFGHARFSTMGGCTVGTVQDGSAACPRENNVFLAPVPALWAGMWVDPAQASAARYIVTQRL